MRQSDRDLILTQLDRHIHRCTCGSWVYGPRLCTTCWTALMKDVAT